MSRTTTPVVIYLSTTASQISTLQTGLNGKADAGTEITGGAFSDGTLTLEKADGSSIGVDIPLSETGYRLNLVDIPNPPVLKSGIRVDLSRNILINSTGTRIYILSQVLQYLEGFAFEYKGIVSYSWVGYIYFNDLKNELAEVFKNVPDGQYIINGMYTIDDALFLDYQGSEGVIAISNGIITSVSGQINLRYNTAVIPSLRIGAYIVR